MSQHSVVLLLGSNLGDKIKNLGQAMDLIEQKIGAIFKKSNYMETLPVEYDTNKKFCNIAVEIKTVFSPLRLLMMIKEIEKTLGRLQDSRCLGGYSDRTIDIDIVYFNSLNYSSETLTIPHEKHIFERDFSKKLISELGL